MKKAVSAINGADINVLSLAQLSPRFSDPSRKERTKLANTKVYEAESGRRESETPVLIVKDGGICWHDLEGLLTCLKLIIICQISRLLTKITVHRSLVDRRWLVNGLLLVKRRVRRTPITRDSVEVAWRCYVSEREERLIQHLIRILGFVLFLIL